MTGGNSGVILVIVVDDEALVRSGLQLILESAVDIHVVATCDGIRAVDTIRRHYPDFNAPAGPSTVGSQTVMIFRTI